MNNSLIINKQDTAYSHTPLKIIKVQKDGHAYSYIQHPLSWQITRLIQALALTIFTVGIGLCFAFVRERWTQALTGKEIIIKKIPEGQKQEIQKKLIEQSGLNKVIDPKKENIPEQVKEKDQKKEECNQEKEINQEKEVNKKTLINDIIPPTPPTPPISKVLTPLHEMLESGVKFGLSQQANAILKNNLSESWLAPHHISAFENLTELDLSMASCPISIELVQSILNQCPKIQTIKGFEWIAVQENQTADTASEKILSSLSDVFLYLIKQPQIRKFIQIPELKTLNKLNKDALKELIILAAENDVANLRDIVKECTQKIIHPVDVSGFLIDFLKCDLNEEVLGRILFTFIYCQKKTDTNYTGFILKFAPQYGKEKHLQFAIKLIKFLSPSYRTIVLTRLVRMQNQLNNLQTQELYRMILDEESEESVKEFMDNITGVEMSCSAHYNTHLLFYSLIKVLDKDQQNKIMEFLKTNNHAHLGSNINPDCLNPIVLFFAEQFQPLEITTFISHLIKYHAQTDYATSFIINFIKEILKIGDSDKIKALFTEFWPLIIKYPEWKHKLFNAKMNWLEKIENLETFKVIYDSIPKDLDPTILSQIVEILKNGSSNVLPIEEMQKVLVA